MNERKSRPETLASTRRPTKRALRSGFTLLEVIVSIGLTTVIIGVIGTAIRMYFVNLKQAQANMELTELARNTLQLMAGDIRSAVQYKPADVSGLQELLDSQAAAISSATSQDEDSPDTGSGESSDDSTDAIPPTESPASNPPSLPPENRPKFIGSNQEIYFDMSRLPRIDQYHPILHMNSNGSFTSLPTDVKGVSYFISFSGDEASPIPGGLYRREIDRATVPSIGGADFFEIDAAAKQVACEIVEVSFRYFDGDSWQDQWNSDDVGGYPSAVEMVIVIDPSRAQGVQSTRYDVGAADPDRLRTFRSVTSLPLAEILSAEEQELIANPTDFNASPSGSAPEEGGR